MNKKINYSDRIFIAGSSGMVGSAVKRTLLNYGYGANEKNKLLTPSRKELNLLNLEEVRNWFVKKRPSVVIVAAAKVGGIYANSSSPADFLIENLRIQNNVIESAWKHDVKRLLFLGSSCIYPKFSKQPIKEEELLKKDLESTNECYAIAKIAGIKLCQALRMQYQFDAISLMPTNLYGPNDNYHPQNSHVIAALIRKFLTAKSKNKDYVTCWGSGSVYREFMHVDDLADAIVYCLENWDPSCKSAPKDINGNSLNHLNIGTGKDITIKELALKIAEITDFKGQLFWDTSKPEGTPKKLLDVSRINKMGWFSKIDLDNGLKTTIEKLDVKSF